MSSNLQKSSDLSRASWFTDLVRAALIERALLVTATDPTEPLARAMVRDPAFMLPIFVSVVADHADISSPSWDWEGDGTTTQNDIRDAVLEVWPLLVTVMTP